jgi:hypothetical protein
LPKRRDERGHEDEEKSESQKEDGGIENKFYFGLEGDAFTEQVVILEQVRDGDGERNAHDFPFTRMP